MTYSNALAAKGRAVAVQRSAVAAQRIAIVCGLGVSAAAAHEMVVSAKYANMMRVSIVAALCARKFRRKRPRITFGTGMKKTPRIAWRTGNLELNHSDRF